MASPIQIVVNPQNFQEARDVPSGGGPPHDFFAERDTEFATHKARLQSQAAALASAIAAQPEGGLGFIKVILRRGAWAKSHRPVRSLFRSDRWSIAGGAQLGEMIIEATPTQLKDLSERISTAELETRWRDIDGKALPNPTRLRSETGAIERLELYGAEDRRRFSRADAISWLSQSRTGGAYLIDLFIPILPEEQWDALLPARRALFVSFRDGLRSLGLGVRTTAMLRSGRDAPRFMLRLERSEQPALIPQLTHSGARTPLPAPFDSTAERHDRLLAFLDRHPLVRQVRLPGILMHSARRASASTPPNTRRKPTLLITPNRNETLNYPVVGVVDGGVSDTLHPWVIGRHGLLAPEHTNESHGTFIAGLLVAANALNGDDVSRDADGVNIVDLNVFPDEHHPTAFSDYYPNGLADFFTEVEAAVANARARWGARIFNFSLNVPELVGEDNYSIYAARLDDIAEAHNVIFVISAGNLDTQRPEWPSDETGALAAIAAGRNDGIFVPAESVRNVAIGAINPPHLSNSVPYAPARYTRRGPGLRAGAKPDAVCVGGSGTTCSQLEHGLFSIDPIGTIISGCGTSYAAPLAAKTLAHLDAAIEGEVSRETLHALLLHHAALPEVFAPKSLRPFSRHLVGFGVPMSAVEMLDRGPSEITIVLATRLPPNQQIVVPFAWPPSLTSADSKCRGFARLTLVASPPVDRRFGAELVRVNVDAALQQGKLDGGWNGRAAPVYLPGNPEGHALEADLIEHGLKWNPVKRYEMNARGGGETSNWRILVKYTTRTNEEVPPEGIPFTAVLTIRDPSGVAPVFQEVQQSLTTTGVRIEDIRTAVRVKPRV